MSEIIIPNEKNTKVLVDGKKLQGLLSFEVHSESEDYSLRELLAGEICRLSSENRHIISLTLLFEELPDEFVLKIQTPSFVKTYPDCRVVLLKEKADSEKGFRREYTIRANGMSITKL